MSFFVIMKISPGVFVDVTMYCKMGLFPLSGSFQDNFTSRLPDSSTRTSIGGSGTSENKITDLQGRYTSFTNEPTDRIND